MVICEYDEPLVPCDSHHIAQYFEVLLLDNDCGDNSVHLANDFYKCDFELLNNCLCEVDWESLFDNRDVNQNVESFTSVMNNIIDTLVSLSRDSPCHFSKKYTSELKSMIIENKKRSFT